VIAALFGSVSFGFSGICMTSQPEIQNCSDRTVCAWAVDYHPPRWTKKLSFSSAIKAAKLRGLTCGVRQASEGTSLLKAIFNNLTKEKRKELQSNLKDLGFYKSSIDGLYGKGTANALLTYNRQHLGGAELKKTGDASYLFNTILALKPSNHPASAIEIIQLEKVNRLKQYAALGITPSQMRATADNYDANVKSQAIQLMTDEAFAVGIVTSEIIDAIRDGGTELLLNRNSLFNSVTYLHFSGMSYIDIAAELTTRQMIIFNYNQAKQRADELEDKRKKEGYTEDEIVAKDD